MSDFKAKMYQIQFRHRYKGDEPTLHGLYGVFTFIYKKSEHRYITQSKFRNSETSLQTCPYHAAQTAVRDLLLHGLHLRPNLGFF